MDTIKLGDPSQPLKSIAVTFLASMEVIEQALSLGANLLITHEPTFYNHPDETDWLGANAVYIAKRRLAEEAGLRVVGDFERPCQTVGLLPGSPGPRM